MIVAVCVKAGAQQGNGAPSPLRSGRDVGDARAPSGKPISHYSVLYDDKKDPPWIRRWRSATRSGEVGAATTTVRPAARAAGLTKKGHHDSKNNADRQRVRRSRRLGAGVHARALAPDRPATGPAYPDLGMARLADFTLDRPGDGRVLLRFSATIVNVGQGPMELNAARSIASGPFSVSQKLYGADGNVSVATPGVSLVYGGDGHNHWHINNLESYELKRLDNGVKVGTAAKSGFCFFDTTAYRTTCRAPGVLRLPDVQRLRLQHPVGDERHHGHLRRMGRPLCVDPAGPVHRRHGLSPGKYRLEATADPSNWFPRRTSRTTRHGSTSR